MQEDKNSVRKAVENKFQEMMRKSNSDPLLKKEVMKTINRIENVAMLIDLFTIKLVQTESSIIKGISGDLDDDVKEKE